MPTLEVCHFATFVCVCFQDGLSSALSGRAVQRSDFLLGQLSFLCATSNESFLVFQKSHLILKKLRKSASTFHRICHKIHPLQLLVVQKHGHDSNGTNRWKHTVSSESSSDVKSISHDEDIFCSSKKTKHSQRNSTSFLHKKRGKRQIRSYVVELEETKILPYGPTKNKQTTSWMHTYRFQTIGDASSLIHGYPCCI